MNRTRLFLPLLACLALLAACGHDAPPTDAATSADAPATVVGKVVGKAMSKVRAKMESGNIDLDTAGRDGAPKAAITPRGDLLIGGRPVAIDDAQRALLLAYRGDIIDLAVAGADLGTKGADFGMRAAGKALRGAFSGSHDQVEAEIEAEASRFEAQAREICKHLEPMLETQQRLAAQLPEFRPYATMDQSDIDDCRSE
ncbi:hypothetical protein [Luteimonas mephitis]|uniref:hypothetical protein n=1 Tax=Luteimonas mephitis TaxID=83615 RepID=UPI00047D4394|nr:hypothetical protein [Luteimonas mephitis]